MNYKVIYHSGEQIGLKTRMQVGRLKLDDGFLLIQGDLKILIPFAALHSVEMFRHHGIGRMFMIAHEEGTLWVSVIRFSWFGVFALVNYFGTGRLRNELNAAMKQSRSSESDTLLP